MDSLGFKKTLLPPPPLGYFQTPLGENLNTGEILSFSFDKEAQPFSELNSGNSQEVDLPQIQNNSQNIVNKKISSEVTSEDINTNFSTTSSEAVTESIVLRKPLGQSLPLVQESNFATFSLIQEFLSSEVQRDSKNVSQLTNFDNLDESVGTDLTDSINPVLSQAKSEPTPISNKSNLINPTDENFGSQSNDNSLNNQKQLPQQSLPESQLVESLSVEENVQPNLVQQPISNQDIIQSQPVESQSNSNSVESQSITTPQQPQFESTTADNVDIDDSSTAIQPQLDNQSQLPKQSLPESQQVEFLPVEENVQLNLVQQPISNQDIIQSQPVESQSNSNSVESQSITTPQQSLPESQQVESLPIEETFTSAISEDIQPNLVQQPISNRDITQLQPVESQSNHNPLENDSIVSENHNQVVESQSITTPQQSLPESQQVESLPIEETFTSAISENIQPNLVQQPISNRDITQLQPVESQSNHNPLENDSIVSENHNQVVESQSITTPQQSLPESQQVESLPIEETPTSPISENIQPNLVQQPISNQDITQLQPVESQSNENPVENDSIVSENHNQVVESQSITTPQQSLPESQQVESLPVETPTSAISENIQPNLVQQPISNQDITQLQPVESQSSHHLTENDSVVESDVNETTQLQQDFISNPNAQTNIDSAIVQPQLKQPIQNIQPKLQSQNDSTLLEQKANNLKLTTIPDDKLDDTNSELPEIIQSNSIDIQARLDNQSLPISEPLTKSSPLAQESDLIISKLVTEFPDETPLTSDSNTSNIRLTENDPQAKANNFYEQSNQPKSSEETPEQWSNISELLSATSQPLTSKNNLLSRNFYSESESSLQQPQIDNFKQESINLLPQDTIEKNPDEWSNISQLIGENDKSLPESNLVSTSVESETYSIELLSPFSSTSSNPTLNDSNVTSEKITQNSTNKNDFIDEQQLEIMAQQIYSILQQRLETDCERQGKKAGIFQGHFSELTNTRNNYNMTPLFDNQLQTLAQEIYLMLQQRIEIESYFY